MEEVSTIYKHTMSKLAKMEDKLPLAHIVSGH